MSEEVHTMLQSQHRDPGICKECEGVVWDSGQSLSLAAPGLWQVVGECKHLCVAVLSRC